MAEFLHERHFTVEEANALIPKLGALFIKMQDALKIVETQRKQAIRALHLARGNGERHHVPEVEGLEVLQDLAAKIEEYGCVIKDFEEALVDFPAIRDGREVYLCWKLGEPQLLAWHELDAGFANREPL